ncbi:uncharacterized protein LOC141853854 [Brevipalpus obovatus]|uniref:uncharacterized protein LOC141853854 n=1 Tax=Brevipalpus obovatus TaxID=246614 RepID=UPI003D9DD66A
MFARTLVVLWLPLFLVLNQVNAHDPIHYETRTGRGAYNFGYDTGLSGSHQFHQESRDESGRVRGRYGYTDPTGKLRLVHYSSGSDGYNAWGDVPGPAPNPGFSPPVAYLKAPHDGQRVQYPQSPGKLVGNIKSTRVVGKTVQTPVQVVRQEVKGQIIEPVLPVKGQFKLPPPPVKGRVYVPPPPPPPPPVKQVVYVQPPPPPPPVKGQVIISPPPPPPVKGKLYVPPPPPPPIKGQIILTPPPVKGQVIIPPPPPPVKGKIYVPPPPPPLTKTRVFLPPPLPVKGQIVELPPPPPPPVKGQLVELPPPPPVKGQLVELPPPPPVKGQLVELPPPPSVKGKVYLPPPPPVLPVKGQRIEQYPVKGQIVEPYSVKATVVRLPSPFPVVQSQQQIVEQAPVKGGSVKGEVVVQSPQLVAVPPSRYPPSPVRGAYKRRVEISPSEYRGNYPPAGPYTRCWCE